MSEERINSQQAPQAELTEEQAARELSEQCLIRREKLAAQDSDSATKGVILLMSQQSLLS